MFFSFDYIMYKRNGKRPSCTTIELCMQLGVLLSTQEARVAPGIASYVLSNLHNSCNCCPLKFTIDLNANV